MKSLSSLKNIAPYILMVLSGAVIGISLTFLFDLKINLQASDKFLALVGKSTPAPTPEATFSAISPVVTPAEGISIPVKWGDLGIRLVEAGGIDMDKYQKNYSGEEYREVMTFLTDDKGDQGIVINSDNAYFWVNTLWALGLTQKSQVLDQGVMGTEYKNDVGNFASTGGWTLGAKDATKLYSSTPLITLTEEQEARVVQIADGIYRPCCDNPTSFPDCNHGMAMLGLIELMVSQGATDEEIYRAALAFNSYWFPSTYVDLAYYYQTQKNLSWDQVDPKEVLSKDFSSYSGYTNVKQTIGNIPGSKVQGGSCGA